jgi:hypothetical protein
MKIIIAGSRGFTDYQLLRSTLIPFINAGIFEVVSGCAKGADELGEQFAAEFSLVVKKFPANWDKYGKAAGYKRNEEMAIYADALVAFWDGQSKGTKHMIDLALKHGLMVKVVYTNISV